MKSFKIDDKGDIVIEDGNFVIVDGSEEMLQSIWYVLSTNINEWFLNMNYGMDYAALFGKGKSKNEIIAIIEDAIYQVEKVKQVFIKNVEINKNRHLIIDGYVTDEDKNKLNLRSMEVIDIG